ncbi:hypothetical protein [Shewanella halotolerans]|uniref:hypothetical protein n=1 Tax=Shewanella halotolerans TaxID=2864204 RepID=UPI001C6585C3|nr:hypothetical protein [Shewanella halotolerans]QYJ89340.1 hypothetical protein K0H81_16420 [Shewanella halotolerans]
MNYPIIELRQSNLFVLDKFYGEISGDKAIVPYNIQRNLTEHIIDSSGDLWIFSYEGSNCSGLRKLISYIWNISQDLYSIEIERNITLGRFKELIYKYTKCDNPDLAEMAVDLLASVKDTKNEATLSSVISKLNL